MRNTPIYNFSAGPATLPESGLRPAQSEMFVPRNICYSIVLYSCYIKQKGHNGSAGKDT